MRDYNPSHTAGFDKEESNAKIEKNLQRLFKLQDLLYAENKRALLIILQGMDTSGKDGVIRHVMKGLNPQGCTVTPFKAPSTEELDHVRVKGLLPKEVWKERYEQINQFEKTLVANGVTILKFFLHISKDEQKKRLEERLSDPAKNWKFNANDLTERKQWGDYMSAYNDLLERCSTTWAPWFIIPSNKKWFRNLAVSDIIIETLGKMNLKLPPPAAHLNKIKVS